MDLEKVNFRWLSRPELSGGTNARVVRGHDEQDNEQILHRSQCPLGADGFESRQRAQFAPGGGEVDCRQYWLFDP